MVWCRVFICGGKRYCSHIEGSYKEHVVIVEEVIVFINALQILPLLIRTEILFV